MSLYAAQDCGPLANPANGSSIGDLTVFPNKITFGCDEGFLLRGSNIRNCQANGTWSGNQTICEGWFLSFPFIQTITWKFVLFCFVFLVKSFVVVICHLELLRSVYFCFVRNILLALTLNSVMPTSSALHHSYQQSII